MKLEKVTLTADFLQDQKLNAVDKIIFGVIRELLGKEDELVISFDELAENCGFQRKVVTRAVCELVAQHKLAFHESMRDGSIRKTLKLWTADAPEMPGKKKHKPKSKSSEVNDGSIGTHQAP